MNKSEIREATKIMSSITARQVDQRAKLVGWAARGMSALARASLRSRNEIITAAAAIPAIVQHQDFIV